MTKGGARPLTAAEYIALTAMAARLATEPLVADPDGTITGPDPVVFGDLPRVSNPDRCWYCGEHQIVLTDQGPTCKACRSPQTGFDPREGTES